MYIDKLFICICTVENDVYYTRECGIEIVIFYDCYWVD